MGNIVKFSTPVSANSIKSGGFNIGVNGTPADLTGFYTGICPINGGYTIYIDKASNGPSIYAPGNDTQLINITKGLGGNVSTATDALIWINSQSNMTVANSNYPSIVTSGLVMNLDAGFVSSYPRTGTAWKDLSGNGNNGTLINGLSYENDSFSFDGTDDAVTIPTITLGNGNWSVCMWVSAGSFNADYGKLLSNNSGGPVSNALGVTSGKISYQYYLTSWNQQLGNTSLTAGPWYFLTWVNSSPGKMLMYVNGVVDCALFTSTTNNGGPVNSIGRNWFSTFPGKMKSISIYQGKSLTDQEILQNYYAGLQRFIPTNGLILSLDAQNTNLYATSATTAYDISGNGNNGALINGVQYVGDVDGSWRFDATDDRIYAVSNVLITNDFTFTVWAKRDGNSSTGIGGIFGNHIHTELSGANIYFTNNSTTVTMSAGNGVTRPAHTVTIPRLNTLWNFYVIMYSGTTYQLYFNGVLLDSRTATVVQSLNTDKYTLGVWALSYLSEYYLNGKISQCSTYNRALTATEISTIYNATKSRYGL
jgi:hypothetical protein